MTKKAKPATAKARAAGGFYVYTLTDPRNGQVFYVGKGCGGRLYQHVADVKRGKGHNQSKCACIAEILAVGLEVGTTIVDRFEREEDAIQCEADMILLDRGALTNILPRGVAQSQPARRAAKVRAAKRHLAMMPRSGYSRWVKSGNWTTFEKGMYRQIRRSLIQDIRDPVRLATEFIFARDGKLAEVRW